MHAVRLALQPEQQCRWQFTLHQCLLYLNACQLTPAAGTPVPNHPRLAVMADACCKAAHFKSSGRAQPLDSVPPLTSSHLGSTAFDVLDRYSAGTLVSEAQQRYACAAAEGGEDDGSGSCSSALTCSRASAAARGVVDFAGISAISCAHETVLRNSVVAMPTPEQHAFHIAAALAVLQPRPDVRDYYADICCRMWKQLLQRLRDATDQNGSPLVHPRTIDQVGRLAIVSCLGACCCLSAMRTW